MKRRWQNEHSKQGGINKTNLYLNNTYNKKHLKHNYGSITVRKNILRVCD